jgi:hypothetical protein
MLPFPGTTRFGAQKFGAQCGSATLQLPDAKQTAGIACVAV